MQHINQIKLTLTLSLDGLVGEDVEYAPALAHYLTSGQHYPQKKVPVPVANTQGQSKIELVYSNLPPLAQLDGSENFKFEDFTSSRYSLVPDIDAKERHHNEYTVNSGRISLSLYDVLLAAVSKKALEKPFVEPMLLDDELAKGQFVWINNLSPASLQTATLADWRNTSLYQKIRAQCNKGQVKIEAQVDNPRALRVYLSHLKKSLDEAEKPNGPYNVNTQRFVRDLEAYNELYQGQYLTYYVINPLNNKPAKFDARASMPEAKMLHLTLDRHHDGHRPAVHYFRNRTKTELKEFPFSKRAVDFFEASFGSALLAVGMQPGQFVQAVQKQVQTKTDQVHPETIRALRGLSYYCGKAAHSIYYSMDVAYKNPKTAARLDALTSRASFFGLTRLQQQTLTLFGRPAWNSLVMGSEKTPPTTGLAKPAFVEPSRVTDYVTMGDRFSKDTMTGVSNTADCDDMGGGNAMNSFMTPRQIHAQFGSGTSSLLDAYVQLTNYYVPFAGGSMVTAAYFEESKNAVMSGEDRKAILDLPLKSSAAYQKADKGGHCHLILNPRVDVAMELQRAQQFSNVLIAQAVGVSNLNQFQPWEYKLPKDIVEGTGQVDGLSVLAAGEVHSSLAAEAAALRTLKKYIQQNCPILRENFHALAGNFYADKPANPDRATNSFFRVFEHLMAPTLYEIDPRMGHFLVCDLSDRTRGVDAEAYLRKQSTMALVSHMADQPRENMDKREELYACIDRQQALNITFRFKEDFGHENHLAVAHEMAMSRVGHKVPLSMFQGMKATELRLQLDQHALGSWTAKTNFGQIVEAGGSPSVETSHLCEPGTVPLALFIRPWHLLEVDLKGLERELLSIRQAGLVKDVEPTNWHERPLAACEDMLTLCMSVPVTGK